MLENLFPTHYASQLGPTFLPRSPRPTRSPTGGSVSNSNPTRSTYIRSGAPAFRRLVVTADGFGLDVGDDDSPEHYYTQLEQPAAPPAPAGQRQPPRGVESHDPDGLDGQGVVRGAARVRRDRADETACRLHGRPNEANAGCPVGNAPARRDLRREDDAEEKEPRDYESVSSNGQTKKEFLSDGALEQESMQTLSPSIRVHTCAAPPPRGTRHCAPDPSLSVCPGAGLDISVRLSEMSMSSHKMAGMAIVLGAEGRSVAFRGAGV